MKKVDVAILGCTGTVGQKFIELLANHPFLNVRELYASSKNAGKKFAESVDWVISDKIPDYALDMKIKNVNEEIESEICFSALPSETAKDLEWNLVKKGKLVISKASANRYEEDVPVLIPEVNIDQLDYYVEKQKVKKKHKGFLITDPNCTTIGLVLTLKPLIQFNVEEIQMVSMQAVSGAGHAGYSSLEMVKNVIPYIAGEEEKVVQESRKILNTPNLNLFATCNRVYVIDGHSESVHIKFKDSITLEKVKSAFINFNPLKNLSLPSSPKQLIEIMNQENRPQPRVDISNGNGMSVSVGRLRPGINSNSIAYTLVSHNTVRGAAGASILDAEYLIKTKKINEVLS